MEENRLNHEKMEGKLRREILKMEENRLNHNYARSLGQNTQLDADEEVNAFAEYYSENKKLVFSLFPEWEKQIPEGGFYYFINLEQYGIHNAKIFCEKLLLETGVALVPGDAYGNGFESYVRISFSNDAYKLKIALNLLKDFLNKWN